MGVYGPRSDRNLNQGDVLRAVPFIARKDLGAKDLAALPGLVVSHSCDVDKYEAEKHKLDGNAKKAWPVTLVPLLSPEHLEDRLLGDVRAHRQYRYFHLPREANHQELVADLWQMQPVPRIAVQRLDRIATLSDEYLRRLWAALIVLFTRVDPGALVKEEDRLAS